MKSLTCRWASARRFCGYPGDGIHVLRAGQ
jgi:hypothetical protein